jgi:hypothetical protein
MSRRKSFCVGSDVAQCICSAHNTLLGIAGVSKKRMDEALIKNRKSTLKKRIVRL